MTPYTQAASFLGIHAPGALHHSAHRTLIPVGIMDFAFPSITLQSSLLAGSEVSFKCRLATA